MMFAEAGRRSRRMVVRELLRKSSLSSSSSSRRTTTAASASASSSVFFGTTAASAAGRTTTTTCDAAAAAAALSRRRSADGEGQGNRAAAEAAAAAAAALTAVGFGASCWYCTSGQHDSYLSSLSLCEEGSSSNNNKDTTRNNNNDDDESSSSSSSSLTPSFVAKEDFDVVQQSQDDIDRMPVYSAAQVAEHNGDDGKPVWMSYGGIVYDVTDFVANHPGGSEKIMMAAGTAMEPFWYVYRQHFASELPMRLMEHMAVGRLRESDQDDIDAQMELLEADDPYAREPLRHNKLLVHSDTPMNCETPADVLTKSYLTPNSLFYIRHHHPVPYLTDKQIQDFRLKVDLTAAYDHSGKKNKKKKKGGVVKFSLDELKKLPKTEVIATLQCSGNRRSGFNVFQRTSGTPWGQGAISTAKFAGVRLSHLLKVAGLDDPVRAQHVAGVEHVRFHALDGMSASIGIEKAVNPYGDCLICYEMNGEPLPRDHGYPLRALVPGYAAVRNVKWLDTIEVSPHEAEGPWQRGLNYKTLPPAITDAKGVNLQQMPSMTEASLYSGITVLRRLSTEKVHPGDRTVVRAKGWAWAGGGRNIVRVDVTGDDGKSWSTANLLEGSQQRFGHAWAWTFWECDVEAVVREDGNVVVASKAVDMAFNVQPEKSDHTWNVRGLGNNSWYRVQAKVA